MKVVVNHCYGGFSLSSKAILEFFKRKEITCYPEEESWGTLYWLDEEKTKTFYDRDVDRSDPDLVAVVEELGSESFGTCAKLDVVDIPDGTDYFIDEYDGMETIRETHRTW